MKDTEIPLNCGIVCPQDVMTLQEREKVFQGEKHHWEKMHVRRLEVHVPAASHSSSLVNAIPPHHAGVRGDNHSGQDGAHRHSLPQKGLDSPVAQHPSALGCDQHSWIQHARGDPELALPHVKTTQKELKDGRRYQPE